jgi:hypothetical protein
MSVTQNDLIRFRVVSNNCVVVSTNAFFRLLASPTCDQLILDDPAAAVQRIEAELTTIKRIDEEWKTLAEKCYETVLLATCHLEPVDDFHRTAHEAANYHMAAWLRAPEAELLKPSTASLRKWFDLLKELGLGSPSNTWGLPERINREYALTLEYANIRPEELQTPPPREKRGGTINDRMSGCIMKNQAAMGWNSREWAEHLKCAESTIVETSVWKKLESARLQAAAERIKDRRRKPKSSDQKRDD